MNLYETIELVPFFQFTYVQNPGAAFSFLSDAGGWQRWFFIFLSILASGFISVWLWRLEAKEHWQAIALSLILGGAIGNLIDRMAHGYVIDFLDVYYNAWHWPKFNVADSVISVGVVMLLIDSFRERNADTAE